ncbi:MAG: hypothetical protein FJ248_01915 [Nitrospira sp.]|nr:hypothetical protein [Nitrospira sp.]
MAEIPESVRALLRPWVVQAQKLFGESLEAVILYGSAAGSEYLPGRSNINLLLLFTKSEPGLLAQYAVLHKKRWQKEQIVAPLILTKAELQASLALFPLEYLEIKEQHILLAGRDPFPELRIDETNLKLQCQQELRGNLLRLRQRFVEGGGTTEAMAILIPLSLTAVLPCLRGLLRVAGRQPERSVEAVIESARRELGVEMSALHDALKLKRGIMSPGPLEMPRLFERYEAVLRTLIDTAGQS